MAFLMTLMSGADNSFVMINGPLKAQFWPRKINTFQPSAIIVINHSIRETTLITKVSSLIDQSVKGGGGGLSAGGGALLRG